MEKKIIAFGASNSKHSINKKLATLAANQINEQIAETIILDLNDFEMPIFSIDRELSKGIPQLAKDFKSHILACDGIIISFAEHNGAYSTAFKNIYDWISRLEGSIWDNKPMLLMATSPGVRGGQSVLDLATGSFKFRNNNVLTSFSLPSFGNNYSEETGIIDEALRTAFHDRLNEFIASLG